MTSPLAPAADQDDSAERARRRSIFRWGAGLILVASVVPLLTGGAPVLTLSAHALWALWVAGVGELMMRRVFAIERAGLASTAGGLLFLPAIILVSGGTGALFYLLLVCLPLIIASMSPTDQPSVVMSGAGGLAWILGLELWARHGAAQIAGWVLFSALCSSIAVWATVLYRRSEAERKRAEAERLAAVHSLAQRERKQARTERLALLGQLAASIAHEVNNPLAYVTANLTYLGDLLEAPLPATPDDRKEVFAETVEGLSRIGNTIRILQLFVRPNGGPSTGHLLEATTEALALTLPRLRKNLVPKHEVPAGLPSVTLAHRRLVQLLVNLILNAADAIEGTPAPSLSISADKADAGVRLVVEDSGRPLPQWPSVTSSDPAAPVRAGLGLALCREHVADVGGTFTIEARPEGGSKVTVVLPLAAASPATP